MCKTKEDAKSKMDQVIEAMNRLSSALEKKSIPRKLVKAQ